MVSWRKGKILEEDISCPLDNVVALLATVDF